MSNIPLKPVTRSSRRSAELKQASRLRAPSVITRDASLKLAKIPIPVDRVEVVIPLPDNPLKRKRAALDEVPINKNGKGKAKADNDSRDENGKNVEKAVKEISKIEKGTKINGLTRPYERSSKRRLVSHKAEDVDEGQKISSVNYLRPSNIPTRARPSTSKVPTLAIPTKTRALFGDHSRPRRIPVHTDKPLNTTHTPKKIVVHQTSTTVAPASQSKNRVERKSQNQDFSFNSLAEVDIQIEVVDEDEGESKAAATIIVEEVKWDDLDEEDIGDPVQVAEYVVEIYEYLRLLETQTLPQANYMQKHKHLGWNQRSILVDWLISLHAHLQLLPETLFLTINIVDRVCSIAHGLRSDKLQLLGVTAMFIAAKYEEIWAPSVQQFAKSTDEGYEEHEITSFEIHILRLLDWNLSYPNPINFLRRATKADGYDERTRTVAKYLIEMSCVEWKMIGTRPSVVAAAGIWLARLVLNKEEWTPNLEHYAYCSEEDLLPTANLMINYALKSASNSPQHTFFFKKYASKKYYKASVHVRRWVEQYWADFHEPDLAEELPMLKADARLKLEQVRAREERKRVVAEE